MKKFLRFFQRLLLLPMLPMLAVEGESDNTGGKADGTDSGATNNTGTGTTGGTSDSGGETEQPKTFTQKQLDDIISKRLGRERKEWEEKMESERKKAAMSETDKLKAEKEEAEKRVTATEERAKTRLIRAEVMLQSAKLNIVDPDAAYALMDRTDVKVGDDDRITGVEEALKALVGKKPYLVQAGGANTPPMGDDQKNNTGRKGGVSMNDLIRKAAGRI